MDEISLVVTYKGAALLEHIVIQFGDRTLKGQSNPELWFNALAADGDFVAPPIQLADRNTSEAISLEGAKGVFFVKSLEGALHDDLRFSDHIQPPGCLWVRVTYPDGEVIEGIIRNDSAFAFKQYFFMAPVDPEANNKLILVIKDQLSNLQILGLRQPWPELPRQMRENTSVLVTAR